jgi:hypothetical protein
MPTGRASLLFAVAFLRQARYKFPIARSDAFIPGGKLITVWRMLKWCAVLAPVYAVMIVGSSPALADDNASLGYVKSVSANSTQDFWAHQGRLAFGVQMAYALAMPAKVQAKF